MRVEHIEAAGHDEVQPLIAHLREALDRQSRLFVEPVDVHDTAAEPRGPADSLCLILCAVKAPIEVLVELLNAYFRLFDRHPAAVIQCPHGLPPSTFFPIIPDFTALRNKEVTVTLIPVKHGG